VKAEPSSQNPQKLAARQELAGRVLLGLEDIWRIKFASNVCHA